MTATTSSAPRTLVHAVGALRRLLDRTTRRRFVWCVVASVGIALIELAGLVVMIPLLSILADGTLPEDGVSGTIVGWTGSTDVDTVVLILTAVAFGFFVLRAIATLVVAVVDLRTHLRGRGGDVGSVAAPVPVGAVRLSLADQLDTAAAHADVQRRSDLHQGDRRSADDRHRAHRGRGNGVPARRERAARRGRAAVLLRCGVRHHQPGHRGAQPAGRPATAAAQRRGAQAGR